MYAAPAQLSGPLDCCLRSALRLQLLVEVVAPIGPRDVVAVPIRTLGIGILQCRELGFIVRRTRKRHQKRHQYLPAVSVMLQPSLPQLFQSCPALEEQKKETHQDQC
jgi:hypothetical protein